MKPMHPEIEKAYPPRGPLHQFRMKEATAFHCFRCGTSKKAKLITIYGDDWDHRLCNGCYGRLLSIYDIKAESTSDDEKATELGNLLLSLLNQDQAREAEKLFLLSENKGQYLSQKTLRFVATSEHVSKALHGVSGLDWSTAVIGLCKAVEVETLERILVPLTRFVDVNELNEDTKDKDIGRVAKFFTDASSKPPELGSFAHFLRTACHSEKRRATSPLIQGFMKLTHAWPHSGWLVEPAGLQQSLSILTRDFRNRAAHTDELTMQDYVACREFVIGKTGILWKLALATQPHK